MHINKMTDKQKEWFNKNKEYLKKYKRGDFIMKYKFIIFLFVLLMVIPLINSFEFDNRKSYDATTKTATITNAFGLGSKLADITLTKNTYSCGEKCYAEGITDLKISGRLIDGLRFTELDKKTAKTISNYKVYIKDGTKEIIVDDYQNTCTNKTGVNTDCERTYIGKKTITEDNWIEYNGDILDAGVYEWRIEGYKEKSDNVEWLATWQGKEVIEWAYWSGESYFNFRFEDNFDDEMNNASFQEAHSLFEAGQIGQSFFSENVSFINNTISGTGENFDAGVNWTIAFWINPQIDFNTSTTREDLFDCGGTNELQMFYGLRTGNLTCGRRSVGLVDYQVNFTGGIWQHIACSYNSTSIGIYVNGTLVASNSGFSGYGSGNNRMVVKGNGAANANYSMDELKFWQYELNASTILDIYTTEAGGGGSGSSTVTLVSPIDNYNSTSNSVNFNCYANTTGADYLHNLSLILDGAINYTIYNTTAIQNLTLSKTLSVPYGSHTWTCNSTNAIGTSTFTARNFNVSRFTTNNEVYSTTTTEGNTETFTINISYNPSLYTGADAYLNYNGVRQSIASKTTNANNVSFTDTIPIPSVSADTNYTFFWEVYLGGSFYNSTKHNQTVQNINVALCNSTYTDLILNISLYDEGNYTLINNSEIGSDIELDLQVTSKTEGITIIDYSNSWIDQNNVSLCLENGTLTGTSDYRIDFTILYNANNKVTEYFYLDNGTLNNGTSLNSLTNKTINLLDLETADSTSFLFNFFDVDGLPVENAIIHTFRKYIGSGLFREVERSKQDENGDTVVHLLEEDVIYYFVVSDNSEILYTSSTYTALCQSVPCLIQLEQSGGVYYFDTEDTWDLITNGSYNITQTPLSRQVNLTYNLQDPATMNLTIYQYDNDGQYLPIASGQDSGTAGTISLTVPQSAGNRTFFATIYKDGDFIKSSWVDMEDDAGLYFGNALSLFLAFLIILTLVLLSVSEGGGIVVWAILGLIVTAILGLVDYRTSTGLGLLVYLICAGGLIIWKLSRGK